MKKYIPTPPKKNPIVDRTIENERLETYNALLAGGRLRAGIPKHHLRTFIRAKKGFKAAAIKAFCLECTGYSKADVRNCVAPKCPLYEVRPYQS